MASLVQLQQLSVSLPNSVTSVTIIEEGGANPVTDHTLFEQWVCHVFPSHVDVNNTRRGEGEGEENNLFEPLDRLQSLCANPSFKHHVSCCCCCCCCCYCCYCYCFLYFRILSILITNKQPVL